MAKKQTRSKYRRDYCRQLIEFFSVEPYRVVDQATGKKVANDMPHLVDFAKKIGVDSDTLNNWVKHFPEWADAVRQAKMLNERFLVVNALQGLYQSTFSIFMAKNKFGWRDTVELDQKVEVRHVYVERLFRRLGISEAQATQPVEGSGAEA